MQPFDSKDFQPYKASKPQHDCLGREKEYWLYDHYGPAREKSFTRKIMKHASADRGTFPFDPSKLTQPLQEEMTSNPAVDEDDE